jgi:hypothetical protein
MHLHGRRRPWIRVPQRASKALQVGRLCAAWLDASDPSLLRAVVSEWPRVHADLASDLRGNGVCSTPW